MPRYMLDTDICCFALRQSNDVVLRRLKQVPVDEVCISVITKSELVFGVELSQRRQQDEAALGKFLQYIEVLDFPDAAASHYAKIRSDLQMRGAMIGSNDLFIAAHARSLGLILITNNVREFRRVPNLKIENWAQVV